MTFTRKASELILFDVVSDVRQRRAPRFFRIAFALRAVWARCTVRTEQPSPSLCLHKREREVGAGFCFCQERLYGACVFIYN
jgi:hypothetical protein